MSRRLTIGLILSCAFGLACDAGPAHVRKHIERAPAPGQAAPTLGAELPVSDVALDTIDLPDLPDVSEVRDAPTDSAPEATSLDDLTEAADGDSDDAASPDTLTADVAPDAAIETVTPAPEGTPADPIPVTRFPFVVSDDTRLSASDVLDRYACAANSDESGPERVYRLDLTAAGSLVAELAEASGVDVDLHLLAVDPSHAPPSSVPCLARANTRLALDLQPGTYWLVVDTYVAASGAKPGSYRLAVEHIVLDAWQVVPLAPGILWKQKVYSDYAGGRQTINILDVDLMNPSVSVRPEGGAGCIRASRVAPAEGAIAAINAGFFDTGPGTCPPLDLVKIEGELVSMNRLTGAAQRSFGVDPAGLPLIAWVAANKDWPEAWSAIGSYPSLVTDGVIALEPDKDTDFFDGRHPRTALGLTGDGHLLLITVDGRGPAGRGMTLTQLAQHLLNLGARDGVNLDGGGSTAMWVAGQSLNGVVNFPSDGDGITHTGERAVSDVLLVFSTP